MVPHLVVQTMWSVRQSVLPQLLYARGSNRAFDLERWTRVHPLSKDGALTKILPSPSYTLHVAEATPLRGSPT